MQKNPKEDVAMARVRKAFKKSGLSLHEVGVRMGYPADSARKSAWQFLRQTDDPRITMLRRFADAMSIDVKQLL